MKSLIFFTLALTITLSEGHARKPAVEDFVGIEQESLDVTPEGTEALYNFNEDVKTYGGQPVNTVIVKHRPQIQATQNGSAWPWTTWAGVFLVLGLPVMTWALTMRHLRTRQSTVLDGALPSNVTTLSSRMKPVDGKVEEKDDIKKAS